MAVERFENLEPRIHTNAFVHSGAHVIGEVTVKEHASIWPGAVLRGDQGSITIGARTSVQDNSVAHATIQQSQTVVGDECTIGHRVILHGAKVGDRCLVGMGSTLLDHVELGEFCFVGANSLITMNKVFPPRSFILGSPAKRVREVTAEEMEWIVQSWKIYQDMAIRYRGSK
jgi:carbonic anhydrase/acetyltransferase-like protein (isoleucine patch superfamily)